MFSGRAPYRGKTPIDVVRSALHDDIPLLENVTPATKDLVRRMMDRNPNLRFPTWKSLKADMELALEKACEAEKTAAEAAAAPATSMSSARGFKYQRTSDAYSGKGQKKNSSVGKYVAIGMMAVSVLIIAGTLFNNSPLARERIDTTYSGPRRAAGLPFTEAELAQLHAAVKAAQSKNADACASAFQTLRSTIPEKHSAMAWSYFFEGACHLYLVKPEAAQKAFQAGTGPKELIFDEGYRPPEDPRYLCALILGKIDYGEFSKKTEKSERWYRSMTEFALGMRIVVQNGYVMDATRHLKAYQEIETRNPGWAYVGQPLADTMIFQGFNR